MDAKTDNPPDHESLPAFLHEFRPGLTGSARAYWLEGDALHWRIGVRQGKTPLCDFDLLRLHLSPEGETRSSTLVIIEKSGHRHRVFDHYRPGWRMKGGERRVESFLGLASALARRLPRANPRVRLLMGPGRAEWIGSVVVALLVVAITVGGLGVMIYHGAASFAALAFMGAAIVQLPLLWPIIRSGGPKPLDPDRLHAGEPAHER